MPNWCENELTVIGKDVAVLLKQLEGEPGGEHTEFDFNAVVPMPPALMIESGTTTKLAIALVENQGLGEYEDYAWVKQNNLKTIEDICTYQKRDLAEMRKIGQAALENKRLYGYVDWYDWSYAKWGTKWNASDVSVEVERSDKAVIFFRTAWAPPEPIVAALAAKFPTYHFHLKYWEGGAGFRGNSIYHHGKLTQAASRDYSGPRGH